MNGTINPPHQQDAELLNQQRRRRARASKVMAVEPTPVVEPVNNEPPHRLVTHKMQHIWFERINEAAEEGWEVISSHFDARMSEQVAVMRRSRTGEVMTYRPVTHNLQKNWLDKVNESASDGWSMAGSHYNSRSGEQVAVMRRAKHGPRTTDH